jgi:phosphohistidine phosphatase
MRRLYLLRHAKSSWDDPDLDDHDRPLARRGRRASKLIGEHLRHEGLPPSLVLCSSAKRARQTLDGIAAGLVGSEVSVEPGLYRASAASLLSRLREVPPEVESVMLIGHQPAIQDLALQVAGGGAERERMEGKFPTAALATFAVPGRWSELSPAGGQLVAYVKPKELDDRRG